MNSRDMGFFKPTIEKVILGVVFLMPVYAGALYLYSWLFCLSANTLDLPHLTKDTEQYQQPLFPSLSSSLRFPPSDMFCIYRTPYAIVIAILIAITAYLTACSFIAFVTGLRKKQNKR